MTDPPLSAYRAKRDFAVTAEPAPYAPASRAGLHWDLRFEHNGMLWSWAVPKGPSLDPEDRSMAVHVEDHPIDYAAFQGAIPAGEYGGGAVETWDRGTWEPLGDPEDGMRAGTLRLVLHGTRLKGRFTLDRLPRRDPWKAEGWFLIKGHDEHARAGIGAPEIEAETPLMPQPPKPKPKRRTGASAPGAIRAAMPDTQAPQLCSLAKAAPPGTDWLSEVKFDGYRILAAITDGQVRLLTRNGLDWAARFAALPVRHAMLDGELVALRRDGVSSFPGLQAALKTGRDDTLYYYAFDLLHLDGWDLRPCRLCDRKDALRHLGAWDGPLRFSEYVDGPVAAMYDNACRPGLEGVVCKRAGAPYRAGRGPSWQTVKCRDREEFVVVGWTPPGGNREGLGSLHIGYYDAEGRLHYAGGVGSGFVAADLRALRSLLDGTAAPPGLLASGEPVAGAVTWVVPTLVVEVGFTGWSGAGRVRHGVFLGLRKDKPPTEVVREVADPDAVRVPVPVGRSRKRTGHGAVPPLPPPVRAAAAAAKRPPAKHAPLSAIVHATPPAAARATMGHVSISHPDRPLWPGITKQDLAAYWQAVAPIALPGLAHRPLSILRCPDGIGGEQFFQKNGHGHLPAPIREGRVGSQPFLLIDDLDGLFAMAQMSAIELHPWGAPEADPNRPDRMVFDLDPGDGVPFADTVAAAHDVRKRLDALGLRSFCRTTGGKGLHVVVPLRPDAGWDIVKPFCRTFAEAMAASDPDRYVAHLKIADRHGKILVDWLRNGLGSTAIASFSPRARPGAGVATPLAWSEVKPGLDPAGFTVLTVLKRLAKLQTDPWDGFDAADQHLPALAENNDAAPSTPSTPTRIVTARKPKPKA